MQRLPFTKGSLKFSRLHSMTTFAQRFAEHTWAMIAEMGTYLLIGFAISVLLHRIIKQDWVGRLMGRKGLASTVWGSFVGVPMPLCSCGVIPVTISLRDKGASRGATVSFLTSTPQTGVDSFLATYGILGPIFAFYKLIVAFISGILVGLTVETLDRTPTPRSPEPKTQNPQTQTPTWRASFRYGFITMPGDLSGSLIIGFLIAGLISALAPDNLLTNIPGGVPGAILLATAISIPFYICSTGSIPLALALIQSGLPVSAAIVLLIAGPATNIATITAMRKILGGRTTVIYVAGVIVATWIAAGIYQLLFGDASIRSQAMHHIMDLPLWKHLGGATLLALILWPHLQSRFIPKPSTQNPEPKTQLTLHIAGMSCSHCEQSVREALSDLPFVQNVRNVDRQANTATIQANQIDETALREKLASRGFEYKS